MGARPKYGWNGTYGPAPRFPWREVACNGTGWLPSKRSLRRNIVVTALTLNNMRTDIARAYRVPVRNVTIIPTSWARSDSHNASTNGADPHSFHTRRRWRGFKGGCSAVDIVVMVRLRSGKLVQLSPDTVAKFGRRRPRWKNGGRGIYRRMRFNHFDHGTSYAREWYG